MATLECSSAGNKKFSAFHARINIFGKTECIEQVYQLSKRFGDFVPQDWRDSKGKEPTHMCVNGVTLDVSHLSGFYKCLWIKYLDAHPELVTYAQKFDTFIDSRRGKAWNSQAECVETYVKRGRKALLYETQDFIKAYKAGLEKMKER